MGFGRRIQYFLVHTLKYTNKEAKALITERRVRVGSEIIDSNIELNDSDEITVDGNLVKKHAPVYLKYYKPVGYVSSLNANVKDSLFEVFKDHLPLIIAGRLDKASEGLLILTNDGKWAKQVTDPKNHKEKEYIVKVSKEIDQSFADKMSAGVDIGFYFTKPCKCWIIDEFTFGIVLTEGKNKQIRRMCKALLYHVSFLKRVRIDDFNIDNQIVGSFEVLKKYNML
ncbi:MAG: rRNA pseudouridine synthase [Sphingobacteriaceae bacterium]|nr:rRNA pseudouridine synthase [Sphingobacteriaceae bacterium]